MVDYNKLHSDILAYSKRRDNPNGLKCIDIDSPTEAVIMEKISKLIPQGILPISSVGYKKERISDLLFTANLPNATNMVLRTPEEECKNYFMIAGRTYNTKPILEVDLTRVVPVNTSFFDREIIVYVKIQDGEPYLYAVNRNTPEGISLNNIPMFIGKLEKTSTEKYTDDDGKEHLLCKSIMKLGKTWIGGYHAQHEGDGQGGAFILRDKVITNRYVNVSTLSIMTDGEEITTDDNDTLDITVKATDMKGVPYAGRSIVLESDIGDITPLVDNKDGSYSAKLKVPRTNTEILNPETKIKIKEIDLLETNVTSEEIKINRKFFDLPIKLGLKVDGEYLSSYLDKNESISINVKDTNLPEIIKFPNNRNKGEMISVTNERGGVGDINVYFNENEMFLINPKNSKLFVFDGNNWKTIKE